MEQQGLRSIPEVILIDVYETLLDMSDIERKVNNLMDSKRGYVVWSELFMQYCFVDNSTLEFHDFISIGRATLRMTGNIFGKNIDEDDQKIIMDILKHLPVHDGVPKGLSGLNDQQFRIAALTNSPESIVRQRMEMSGLVSYFEQVFSAEKAKKYKPSKRVYLWAAEQMNVNPENILMVTSHGWDIAGAENAGLQTAYLQRPNEVLYPLAPVPNMICKSIPDLCEQLMNIRKKIAS
jgi:2-haloacid dehalogenase